MKILLVGDRAREHILAEQLARSAELYAVMQYRNPGIERTALKYFLCDFSNIETIGGWAIREGIDLALVTSETAMAKGLVDALMDVGITTASPPSSGSVIGENTAYARNMMNAAGIPTPRFIVCRSESDIKKALKEMPQVVVKPALKVEWKGTRFGDIDLRKAADIVKYGKQMIKRQGSVIIEEVLDGESFSLQGITDGKDLSLMPPVYTAKRLDEGNRGELTEGMGGLSCGTLLPFMRQSDLDSAREYLRKLISVLKSNGVDYRGAMRGEFFVTRKGVIMLDAHATFGGVTTLNNMLLLKTQLSEVLTSVIEGKLKPLSFIEKATVVKFLVPPGYPKRTRKTHFEIDERALWNNGAKAYFESVEVKAERPGMPSGFFTGKHRTIAICASGQTIEEAQSKTEDAVASIKGGLVHRKDIASSEFMSRMIKHMALVRGA